LELEKIWSTISRGRLVILYITLISVLASALLSLFVLPRVYQATATLMVGKAYIGQYSSATLHDDISLANSLMNSFTIIATSRSVAERAIKNENISIEPGYFQQSLSASCIKESQIIMLSASADTPERAANWANYASKSFMDVTKELNELRNVNVIDYALPPGAPIKPKKIENIVRSSFLGLTTSFLIIFLFKGDEQ